MAPSLNSPYTQPSPVHYQTGGYPAHHHAHHGITDALDHEARHLMGSKYYGMISPELKAMSRVRSRMNLGVVLQCLFGPWLMFTLLFAVWCLEIRYKYPQVPYLVTGLCVLVVLAVGYMGYKAYKRQSSALAPDVHHHILAWYGFAFVSLVVVVALALLLGDLNFYFNFQPYFDVMNLQTYENVDPTVMRGNQVMDAGQVSFLQGAQLDHQKSMGFKNLDWYCVVPITQGSSSPSSYDFWAVGINCCTRMPGDFKCGEWNNPSAHSGLRLMRDDLRPFFRLTVEQAEAKYGIKATHPLFFYWMEDPLSEMNAYRDDGLRCYLLGVFVYLAWQILSVILAVIFLPKA